MDLSGRGGLPPTDTDLDVRAVRPAGAAAARRGLGGLTDLLFLMLGAAGLLAVMMPEEGRDRLMLPLGVMTLAMAALAVLSVRRARAAAAALDRSARLLRTANEELAASRQRFRDFAEAASDWFWESASDHRYTYVSERLPELLGGDPAPVFGDSLLDLGALVEDTDTWLVQLADIEAGRAFRDLEIMLRDGAGDTRVFRISAQPFTDADGRFAGYRGTGIETTAETLALVEARFMQSVVHDALSSISEGFVLFSPDDRLIFCNERYRSAYPNLADVLVPGTAFKDILRAAAERGGYDGDDREMANWIAERMKRHLLHTDPVDGRLSDGRWYRISEHATGSGGIVKILMDITELKRREEQLAGQTERLEATVSALSESEKRYRQLVELAPYGIVIWDRRAIRFGNAAAASILGVGGNDGLEGVDLNRFIVEAETVTTRLGLGLGLGAEGDHQRVECAIARPSGEQRHVEIGAFPAVYQREPAVLLVLNDVTDRRRAEAELQKSQKMEAVGRMAGGIAHEFNNMLTAIGGFARLAERAPDDPARVTTCVREIAKASDRAAALTAQLLDFSRRRPSDETEVVALAPLVRDLKIFLKPLMSAGIDLDIRIGDADTHAVANPVMLNQAILNLALNARDAMPDGGRLTIALDSTLPDAGFFGRHGALAHGRYAVIRVIDEGCGVPEAVRDRIWEPFFTTKEPGKGTGLGLWMVYGTAQQAGGAVEMEAGPDGRGSVFSIHLPAVPAPVKAGSLVDGLGLGEDEGAAILLVDDEDSVRTYVRLALEEAGCTVTEAVDGLDALERWDECGGLFDAVVSDMSMPRMNGLELSRALAERNPDLRILFLTGYASHETAADMTAQPGRRIVMKPVAPDRLIEAVRGLLAE
ncbi:hybrid sensor histidine kinase/response regulator [Azospirillum brasilense]|nr:response regulator [Azospirillum brasilense]